MEGNVFFFLGIYNLILVMGVIFFLVNIFFLILVILIFLGF